MRTWSYCVFLALVATVQGFSALTATSSFTIVASFYPVYIATRNVARDVPNVRVVLLAPPTTGCLHDYQLTPADLVTLGRADVVVLNGAGMEPMLEPWIKQHPHVPIIDSSAGIALITTKAHCHGHDHHHAHAACEVEPNPHYWLSIARHIQQVENIALGLAAADPVRAACYHTNAAAYVRALRELKAELQGMLADVAFREIVTMHDAFAYFAKEFGLHVVGVVERIPGQTPSAREMAQLAQLIRARGVRAIFTEPQYSDAPARALARETGTLLAELDTIVTGPDELDAYLVAMRRNAKTLREVLSILAHSATSLPSNTQGVVTGVTNTGPLSTP